MQRKVCTRSQLEQVASELHDATLSSASTGTGTGTTDNEESDRASEGWTAGLAKWWSNPHRALLGLGNYDANVLELAVRRYAGKTIKWFDVRQSVRGIPLRPQPSTEKTNATNKATATTRPALTTPPFAIVVNVARASMLVLRTRHWLAIRQLEGTYFNLDSQLAAPEPFGSDDEVHMHVCRTCFVV